MEENQKNSDLVIKILGGTYSFGLIGYYFWQSYIFIIREGFRAYFWDEGAIRLTYKAIFWPFFLTWGLATGGLVNPNPYPIKFTNDAKAFIGSVSTLQKSMDLTQPSSNNPIGKPFKLSEEQNEKAKELNYAGIQLSKKVSDEFLDWLHPEAKEMYRDRLIGGATFFSSVVWPVEEVKEMDVSEKEKVEIQLAAVALINQWLEWKEKNQEVLGKKLFGD